LIATALLTLLLLGLSEVVLRVFDFSYYWSVSRRADRDVGWRPSAGARAWQRFEGTAFVRINARGFRDRERDVRKPEGTVRIAVLGDSFAEAVQVPVDQTFWSVVERKLDAWNCARGRRVEIINFGVSGYSTAQQLLILQHDAWAYAPDIVMLAFFQGNDLSENVRELDKDSLRPYFELRNGQLTLDDGFRRSAAYRMRVSWYGRLGFGGLTYSRLLQALDWATDMVKQFVQARRPVETTELFEPGVDNRIYETPRQPVWRQAWEITEGLLDEIHRQAIDRGVRLLVVTLTTGAQVHPDPGFRNRYARALGQRDLFYPDRRIAAAGEREGYAVLNLAPLLQRYATRYGVFLHGFDDHYLGIGHWNKEGHRLAGEIIAEHLCESGALMNLVDTDRKPVRALP
jgi:hypothetical protein